MQDTTASDLLELANVDRSNVSSDWASYLLLLGSAAPVCAALVVIFGGKQWSLPHAKLLMLSAQYLLMLPLFAIAILRYRDRQPRRDGSNSSGHTHLLTLVLLFSALLIPLAFHLGLGRYQGDESAYLFEARCLATGHLSAAQPMAVPHKALGFAHHLLIHGRWSGKYPPGWPALLSLATATKSEWLLNPVLGLVLLLLTYQIARRTFGQAEALSATAMLATSAFMLLNCLGFMSHVLCAVLVAVAVVCFTQSLRRSAGLTSSAYWTVGMLLSLTAAELVRPFTGLCVGAALISALFVGPDWKAIRRFIGWTVAFALLTGLVMGFENYLLTGNPFQTAYSAYNNGQLKEFSLKPADLLAALSRSTPVRLVDTASVSFPFMLPFALYGLWRRRQDRMTWGISLVFLSLVLGYVVQLDDSDSPIGERYYFEGYFALALVAGIGVVQLARDLRLNHRMRQQLAVGLVCASLACVLVGTRWEVGLRQPSKRMVDAMQKVPFRNGIVFVAGSDLFPAFNWNFNDPGTKILELIDPGPKERAAIARAAGAPHWASLEYDQRTGSPVWGAGDNAVPGTSEISVGIEKQPVQRQKAESLARVQ
jgi:Dolichyl-phosphate-mannose-protein mannosyltransferase